MDIENVGSFFSCFLSGQNWLQKKAIPLVSVRKRHKSYSFQVLLRPKERNVIVDSNSLKEIFLNLFSRINNEHKATH